MLASGCLPLRLSTTVESQVLKCYIRRCVSCRPNQTLENFSSNTPGCYLIFI